MELDKKDDGFMIDLSDEDINMFDP